MSASIALRTVCVLEVSEGSLAFGETERWDGSLLEARLDAPVRVDSRHVLMMERPNGAWVKLGVRCRSVRPEGQVWVLGFDVHEVDDEAGFAQLVEGAHPESAPWDDLTASVSTSRGGSGRASVRKGLQAALRKKPS